MKDLPTYPMHTKERGVLPVGWMGTIDIRYSIIRKGGRPTVTGGGVSGDGERRRQERLVQLGRMTDEEFACELESHKRVDWTSRRLKVHVEKHGEQLSSVLGVDLDDVKLAKLTVEILSNADRVLTGIDQATLQVEYAFVRLLRESIGLDDAIIALARGGAARSVFPTAMERWLKRRSDMVEVTSRVQALGQKP